MSERAALRLFFALWPDADLRARIAQEAAAFADAGRAIPLENLHVTLLFLGSVDRARVPEISKAAARARSARFDLEFDQIEFWPRAHVMCLTSSTRSESAAALAHALRQQVAEVFELRRDEREYQPHVTLARDVRRRARPQSLAPIEWQAREFVLVESNMTKIGSSYTVVERWPLGDEETG